VLQPHRMVGWLNPRCTVCGRTAIWIGTHPTARCERMTLPFEFDVKPTPAKAELKTTKERAS
jgi:hypothetical protein